jgi:hypothetical protein
VRLHEPACYECPFCRDRHLPKPVVFPAAEVMVLLQAEDAFIEIACAIEVGHVERHMMDAGNIESHDCLG